MYLICLLCRKLGCTKVPVYVSIWIPCTPHFQLNGGRYSIPRISSTSFTRLYSPYAPRDTIDWWQIPYVGGRRSREPLRGLLAAPDGIKSKHRQIATPRRAKKTTPLLCVKDGGHLAPRTTSYVRPYSSVGSSTWESCDDLLNLFFFLLRKA